MTPEHNGERKGRSRLAIGAPDAGRALAQDNQSIKGEDASLSRYREDRVEINALEALAEVLRQPRQADEGLGKRVNVSGRRASIAADETSG